MQPGLLSMPIEIWETIMYWLHQLSAPQPKHQQTGPIDSLERYCEEDDSRRLRKFQKTHNGIPLIDIRSLASANRSLYQTFSPLLFEGLDFQGFTVDQLKRTVDQEIVQRHSDHVRMIRCRLSDFESLTEERKELMNARDNPNDPVGIQQWDAKSRSELLDKIIESCPRLTSIDIDLDPQASIPIKTQEILFPKYQLNDSTLSDHAHMPNLFIRPISQLTSLTHLSLNSPSDRSPYTEPFLVDILTNLSGLQSFTCSRIAATHPSSPDQQETCQSPLGLHLASLVHLDELHLEKAACLDDSWTLCDWKSSLKALSLIDCDRVTVLVFHKFINLSRSTLTSLMFHNLSFYIRPLDGETTIQDLQEDKIQFDLPRLINLGISSYLPIQFLRAFQQSKDLSWLSLGQHLSLRSQDLGDLIQEKIWPNLKKFEITNRTRFLYRRDVDDLEALCKQHAVEMIFNGTCLDEKDIFNPSLHFEVFLQGGDGNSQDGSEAHSEP